MKGNLKEKNNEVGLTKGITLVALVVTIVVLLILAGITIVYVFGDNGIIKLAQEAKDKTEQGKQNEQEEMGNLVNWLKDETGSGGATKPEEVPIENIKSDWATIEKVAKEIAKDNSITSESEEAKVTVDGKSYTIKPGDMFEVEYDGATRRVRVLGFKHDELVNQGIYGSGITASKASISFEFYDFMTGSTNKQMNTSNDNTGGWGATQMRKDLNGYTTSDDTQSGAIGGEGAKLSNKNYIKQVKKQYIKTYSDASTNQNYTQDYLWLLACSEVFNAGYQANAYGYAITTEGNQYKYYQGVTQEWDTSSTGRVKYNGSGSALDWWLRSPDCSDSSGFCNVFSYGDANNGNASDTYGVAPGFAI